jgi:hypothetical protein
LTLGIVSCGPVVVCANAVATLYDQFHAMIVPGAVDVLPLNVQLSVLPLLLSVQVSVSVGPVTPKLAAATVGRVTESTADADAPPYEPLMVLVLKLTPLQCGRRTGGNILRSGSGGYLNFQPIVQRAGFGDFRTSGTLATSASAATAATVLGVASHTAEVARFVPVMAAQILRSSLLSRFCVFRFGALLQR